MIERRNVAVMAPTEMHWRELSTCRAPEGEGLAFHALLGVRDVVHIRDLDAEAVLDAARRELDRIEREHGSVDAIIAHWDFPSSLLVPILCRERGLPSPSIEAVVQASHKLYARLAHRRAVPELVPPFALVDPYDADAARTVELELPFWIKPVQSFSSHLGFRVDSRADLERALNATRADLARSAEPWDRLLRAVDVEPRYLEIGARHCIAEGLLAGIELAHEGSVLHGQLRIHGTLDMPREQEHFVRFTWPSQAPGEVLARMEEATRRVVAEIGFDEGCFNTEYFWDPSTDQLWLVELNPRISQSHSPLCVMVDGVTNHQVAVDVALGRPTLFRPRAGEYPVAAKFMERWDADGVVTRVPTDAELRTIAERHPSAWVELEVEEGQRLSEMVDQDAYGYQLIDVYLGASDPDELDRIHERLRADLRLEVQPVPAVDHAGLEEASAYLPDGRC